LARIVVILEPMILASQRCDDQYTFRNSSRLDLNITLTLGESGSQARRGFIAVDKDRIRIWILKKNFREIGKLLEHVNALSGPESPTLPEGE
jgi:hypothetical protein